MVLVFSTFPRPLKAAIIGVPAAGAVLAALAGLVGGFNAADQWRLLLIPGCFVAVAVAERYPVKIGLEQKINLGALPCLVAVLLLPAGIGPATAALSVLVGNHLVGRSRPESVFNAGNTLAASAVAALVGAVGPDVDGMQEARAALGALLYAGVNLGLGVLPAALRSGRRYPELLKQAASATWPALLTLAACAVAISVLWIKAPLIAPLPLIVLPMIYRMNRAIEAQSKANEQLAGVLAAQRRFLTDVSHQVATPLATIMTNLSILRRANGGKSGVDAVTDSVAEAERMKRMLERLRSLAHADEDVPLRRELVDLAELTADVVRAYAVPAATSGVELVADVGAHASVSADKDLLREAVANLVDNAVRVSPPGAHVTLSVERGSAGPVIAVADEGPGIEEDRLPRLFERFQRSDSGSGLGLAIARRVVERHGGTIRVKTARGAGSTFTIELPG
ncbi:MAG TPA: HAMP domain-containing sensor histidine kinase [Gemmatimonadales bacterium]|jgi:signal transduction histidine kinase|nr:HAMP domain-containing sensor histidine kinase [Gemmatimonadales bacterium]